MSSKQRYVIMVIMVTFHALILFISCSVQAFLRKMTKDLTKSFGIKFG